MKQCPQCNSFFDDDSEYCLNDGTTLVADTVPNHYYSNETPTVYTPSYQTPLPLPPSPPSAQVTSDSNMKWVFPVIGLLLGLVVVLGFLVFSGRNETTSAGTQKSSAEKSEEKEKSGSTAETAERPMREDVQIRQAPTDNQTGGIPGRFPEGSARYLGENDITGKSSWDLRIMRNEIFARHGYVFKNADLRNYFMNQVWYQPAYNNVSGFLNPVEKRNIEFLKSYE